MKAEQINEVITNNKFPTITISRKAIRKMDYLISQVDTEVGWMGTVEESTDENGITNYYITDIFVPKQDVAAATCEIQAEGRTKLTLDILAKYGDEEGEKIVNSLKFWGHSHVDMGVTPSGQDDRMILDFKTRDWFLRGIFNKKGDIKLDVYNFKQNIKYLDIVPTIETDLTDEERNELDNIIKNNLAPLVYKQTPKQRTFAYDEYYGCDFDKGIGKGSSRFDKYFQDDDYPVEDNNWSYVWNPILGKCEKVPNSKKNKGNKSFVKDNTVIRSKPLYPNSQLEF